MSTKEQIFRMLMEHRGQSVSGETLGEALGISRAAVWKGINALRKDGYPIEAITNKGYCLAGSQDYLSSTEISRHLRPEAGNIEIQVYDSVESTNKTAKELALTEPDHFIAVISNEQTAGRGRLGRSFYSPENAGLYMSILFRPTFDMSHAILVTTAASVAVVRAIETLSAASHSSETLSAASHSSADFSPEALSIKWVNDIYLNDKKICGILTEAISDFETGGIEYVVLGIGINCFEVTLPPDLSTTVGNLGGGFSRNQLAAEILNQWAALLPGMEDRGFLDEYRNRSGVLGKKILVFPPGVQTGVGMLAQALEIDRDGGLVVQYLEGEKAGNIETLSGGEVSIRPST